MLRVLLMDKVDSMQEHMGNVNRDGNPKKEPKEMLEMNTITEMKNDIDGLTKTRYS